MKHNVLALMAALALTSSALAADAGASWSEALLDNCEAADNVSSIGTAWTPSLDAERGGTSSIEWFSSESTFGVTGVIEPIPGSMGPGTAGMVLPLGPEGAAYDVNEWDGIRISIKRSGAPLLLRIHSSEIGNGDYFAVMIPESRDFKTYSFRFKELGQVMSAQQPWSGKNVTGVELATFGWTTTEFSWEIEELAFYQDEPADSILNR